MERVKHESLSCNFWLNWFSGWGSKALHIEGFSASFPVYLPAWHILAVHRYLTYNWWYFAFVRPVVEIGDDFPVVVNPLTTSPLQENGSNVDFLFHLTYLGVIFLSLYHLHFQQIWPSHSLLLHITPPVVGRSIQWKNRRIYTGKTSIMCQLDVKKPSHPISFKTLP